METNELIIASIIHLVIPFAGLIFYLNLIRKIKKEKISSPPYISLFLIFATYGGLLLMTLTILIWEWSAMASLGTFLLIFEAPIAMGIIAYQNYKIRSTSKYHVLTYKSALYYFIIAPIAIFITFIFE